MILELAKEFKITNIVKTTESDNIKNFTRVLESVKKDQIKILELRNTLKLIH